MDVCIHLSKNVKHILWLGRVLGDEGGYSSKQDRQKHLLLWIIHANRRGKHKFKYEVYQTVLSAKEECQAGKKGRKRQQGAGLQ